MPKRVKSHFHCLTVIGVERKMVSMLCRRKKSAAGTSNTPSNASTSCTAPSVNNIPSAESLESCKTRENSNFLKKGKIVISVKI